MATIGKNLGATGPVGPSLKNTSFPNAGYASVEDPGRRNLDWTDPEGLMRARMAKRATVKSLIDTQGQGGESGRGANENSRWDTQKRFVAQRFDSQSAHNSADSPFGK